MAGRQAGRNGAREVAESSQLIHRREGEWREGGREGNSPPVIHLLQLGYTPYSILNNSPTRD